MERASKGALTSDTRAAQSSKPSRFKSTARVKKRAAVVMPATASVPATMAMTFGTLDSLSTGDGEGGALMLGNDG